MDKYLLWYLLAGTRGGINRIKIIKALQDKPQNANQLSEFLKMDYKTIKHHLHILSKNRLVHAPQQDIYGGMYFITQELEINISIYNEILEKLNKQQKVSKSKK